MQVSRSGSTGNRVQGNLIGTDVSGTGGLPNVSVGLFETLGAVHIYDSASNNTVGGTEAGAGNVISGNQGDGVLIVGSGAAGNAIQGNLIGTDVTGSVELGNSRNGVFVNAATSTLIGGTTIGAGNVISGHGDRGVLLGGYGAVVQGNYIGTNAMGNTAIPNVQGITINSAGRNHTIGGTAIGVGNVVSGNIGTGVSISGVGNIVKGNLVGTDSSGTLALPNGSGLSLGGGAANNVIGGVETGAGNVISGNNTRGIIIQGATQNVIQGNLVGVQIDGASALGNGWDGVHLGLFPQFGTPTGTTIGGRDSGAGNTIAFNGRQGLLIENGTGTAILGNRIFSNSNMGIDIDPAGPTANDPGDLDGGPNNLQNFPVLTSATAGSLNVIGTLNSVSSTIYRLEFFSNPSCDASGHGEGETYIGFLDVTADADGDAVFNVVFPSTTTPGFPR